MTDNSHQLENINPHTGEPYKERPNKTQLKREMKMLHDLGQELVELPNAKLEQITLSDRMQEAVASAKKMKKSALQRQLRFIAGIIQEEDIGTIELELKQLAQPLLQEKKTFHKIEEWRDRLLAGDNDLINQIVTENQQADRQHIRQLVRNANKETQQNKPPKSARLLFHYLKEIVEA